jgi:uncharacterized YccA/Bax inhibitor family protein
LRLNPEIAMKRHLITAVILLAAVMLYAYGSAQGGAALIVAGAVFECWFWARALGLKLPHLGKTNSQTTSNVGY